jgi:hypothetical protein
MRGWGSAVVSMALLSMLRGAAEAAAGVACAGSRVVPLPAVVILQSLPFEIKLGH